MKTDRIFFIAVLLIVAAVAVGLYVKVQKQTAYVNELQVQKQNAEAGKNIEIEDLQAQKGKLEADNQAAMAQAAQLRSQVSRLAPDAARARQLPIGLGRRKAVTGDGDVLILKNTSTKTLSVVVKLSNLGSSKTYRLVIDGLMTKEIGYLEGWAIASGDTITMEATGYDPVKKVVGDTSNSSTQSQPSAEEMRNACINNLRQIDGAKQQWALENRKTDTDIPTAANIAPDLKNNIVPQCPAGGVYVIGAVNADPTCSISGHALPTP